MKTHAIIVHHGFMVVMHFVTSNLYGGLGANLPCCCVILAIFQEKKFNAISKDDILYVLQQLEKS